MLNCAGPTEDDPICVPDSGEFPAKDGPNFSCSAFAKNEGPEGKWKRKRYFFRFRVYLTGG